MPRNSPSLPRSYPAALPRATHAASRLHTPAHGQRKRPATAGQRPAHRYYNTAGRSTTDASVWREEAHAASSTAARH
eukprot:scaffold23167_cov63-Phaeocystis_antarctica.AAC.3